MKIRSLLFLFMTFALLLCACSVNDSGKTMNSVLDVITLQTTPSLEHWLDQTASCANNLPGVGVYANITPISDLDIAAADLTIRLGNPLDSDPFVTILGRESLVIIAGPEAPVTRLSLESLQAVFTGEIQNWGDVPEVIDAGLTINEPITVLSYPQGNDLRSHIAEIYLESGKLTNNAGIFFTADTQTELLEENPTAITYSLASQVPATAQILTITGLGEKTTDIYVIAITQSDPAGTLRSLIFCIQN